MTARRRDITAGMPADVVVVGSASRDLTDADPRGWRLGGAVTYASLMLARLGLRVVALVGVDAAAAKATELELLRDASVDVHLAPLASGPVFRNVETPGGRVQWAISRGDALAVTTLRGLPDSARHARAWFLGPVARELGEEWARSIPPGIPVALGWQGLLRTFSPNGVVRRRAPGPSALVRRASLVGVSRDDLAPGTPIVALVTNLEPGAVLALTHGSDGGLVFTTTADSPAQNRLRVRRYPALPSSTPRDPTGAGDTFLAVLLASGLLPEAARLAMHPGGDLLIAAAAASCVVEDAGLLGVPTRSAICARVNQWHRETAREGGEPDHGVLRR